VDPTGGVFTLARLGRTWRNANGAGRGGKALAFWCGRRDLNPHTFYSTGF
jgi:hypothetical protein